MAMPEAAMDKDHGAAPSKDEVGFAGQTLAVQAVPVAKAVHEPADGKLRLSVPTADPGHASGALRSG